jgi:hypothetical protein
VLYFDVAELIAMAKVTNFVTLFQKTSEDKNRSFPFKNVDAYVLLVHSRGYVGNTKSINDSMRTLQ